MVDLGTTSIKGGLFHSNGDLIREAAHPNKPTQTEEGFHHQEIETWWSGFNEFREFNEFGELDQ